MAHKKTVPKKTAPKKQVPEKEEDEQKTIQVVERIIQQPAPTDEFSKFTPAQLNLIKRTIAQNATDDELSMFIQVCASTKLNPFLKQIHFVKRWDSKAGKEVGAIQVGIDGLRSIADRTEAYVGSDEPKWTGEVVLPAQKKDAKEVIAPEKCTVTVKKVVQGIVGEFTGEARWSEFYPGDAQGFMWRKMPHVLLGKCAEAQALRKAFPSQMSGLYVQEELDTMQVSAREEQNKEKMFQTAKAFIAHVETVKELEELKGKIHASDKYDEDRKKELLRVIDAHVVTLQKRHASQKISVVQPNDTDRAEP